ncbi:Sporulation related domain-containing protein [Parapedobacter composti]|uniref:Sporulation related domain-containing protein n=1 Tax=Parapedobacter composti TaxID=623281 RepID=A0A1I1IIR8_9SPHI|nr:SPOR domain-containing protein [Parapedobacter composti]SFC36239.1 Sporulation related domain-containing protein [Parapedobacter composti]
MVKKGFGLVGLLLCLACLSGYAQQKGSVEIVADPLIGLMQRNRMGTNITATADAKPVVDKKNATRIEAMGFRVQIYSGPSRSEAYAEQARFKKLYKDIDTYVSYEQPNYRVKVGDFRSRTEAQRLMQGLKKQFNNVFIFTEKIFVYQ